ncbi:MAG: hypothetical protein OEL88_10795 [Sterolibacteriaceae bacterium MAG5]|nr:hypothetical protein [Candidatus Nitricoxidireducens bremensis]
MAVDSVSSSTSANAQLVRSQRQPEQVERPRQERRAEPAPKPEPQAAAQTPEVKKPQPVVNTQGQKTGTIINTSA